MKKLYKYLIILLLFPIYFSLMDGDSIDPGIEEKDKQDYKKFLIVPIIVIILFYILYSNPFAGESYSNPYDMTIDYKYPDDGQVRPPQNPKTVAQKDYFVIPDKPYFVGDIRNFLLLDKDMIEYINMPLIRPIGIAIPPYFVKWLEICYGYDITQEFFMNLEYHRKLTLPSYGIGDRVPYVSMEQVFKFVRWYYRKGDHYRPVYSIWFTPDELAYMEGKDFYDLRIFPKIYTRRKEWPAI